MNRDEIFMRRCFRLAEMGNGTTETNPMVGCVVVHKDEIIGEGYHRYHGAPHAEVNALASVKKTSLLPESALYVNLEPCCHFGKTPPCADLIVEKKIKEVVICNRDPNPKVDGGGIDKLRKAGVSVKIGILEEEGRLLNRKFFTWIEKKRPHIILKWAQTANGYMAPEKKDHNNHWITNNALKVLNHKWRTEEKAILIGYNTAKEDNPQLTNRHFFGRNPVRIVIDPEQNLPKSLNIFQGTSPALVLATPQELFPVATEKKWSSIIVEGGVKTLLWFIENNLWDEARVLIGNIHFPKGLPAPLLTKIPWREYKVGDNSVRIYINKE